MTLSINTIHKNVWFTLLAALAVLIVGSFIVHHVDPIKRDLVATAFLGDIVFTIPVIYYFLLIRPGKVRKWSIVLVFSICCGVAYLILPAHQRTYIIQLRKLSAGLEIGVIVYALSKIRQIKREYRALQNQIPDFAYNLKQSMGAALGNHPAVKFLATEVTMLRFGLLFWMKPQAVSSEIKPFSNHRESGYGALFGVILCVGIIETVAFHLFLNHYSHTWAIIVTALTVYSFILIIGDFSAMVKSPVLVLNQQLLLRIGIRWRALIDLNNIQSAEKIMDSYTPDEHCFKGGPMKSTYNVLLTFKEPVNIERIYRKPKAVTRVVMMIDDVDGFVALINPYI
ncbi:hypothetical protein [Mucilaginibacter sp. dw_454]|uniref:hypothetical protein n=1 Tax=Mucilaginibacter sp. dw_454 TaxID=2720079 RepID=UPI001BD1C71A|nr:hypothetical protein [Mucilaginibacter sp. dw_454]